MTGTVPTFKKSEGEAQRLVDKKKEPSDAEATTRLLPPHLRSRVVADMEFFVWSI